MVSNNYEKFLKINIFTKRMSDVMFTDHVIDHGFSKVVRQELASLTLINTLILVSS